MDGANDSRSASIFIFVGGKSTKGFCYIFRGGCGRRSTIYHVTMCRDLIRNLSMTMLLADLAKGIHFAMNRLTYFLRKQYNESGTDSYILDQWFAGFYLNGLVRLIKKTIG